MKIALPSAKGVVDGHFGHCESFAVFTVDENKQVVKQEAIQPPPGCGCKSNIVGQLAEMGVTVMLAGNMGQGAVNVLGSHGIKVVRGCRGPLQAVVEAWLAGNVVDSGLGCSEHEHHHHGGHDCSGH
jgi:predicted Fe-Mo cluster-binding NifX family protein